MSRAVGIFSHICWWRIKREMLEHTLELERDFWLLHLRTRRPGMTRTLGSDSSSHMTNSLCYCQTIPDLYTKKVQNGELVMMCQCGRKILQSVHKYWRTAQWTWSRLKPFDFRLISLHIHIVQFKKSWRICWKMPSLNLQTVPSVPKYYLSRRTGRWDFVGNIGSQI